MSHHKTALFASCKRYAPVAKGVHVHSDGSSLRRSYHAECPFVVFGTYCCRQSVICVVSKLQHVVLGTGLGGAYCSTKDLSSIIRV